MNRFPDDIDPTRRHVALAVGRAIADLHISTAEASRRARAAAEARGISPRGLSPHALGRLLSGDVDATVSTITALALALEVPLAQLYPALGDLPAAPSP